MKNYLFAGASSGIASATIKRLDKTSVNIIGLSRQATLSEEVHRHYQVLSYSQDDLPTIQEPLDGLVYFPGTINLKPFNKITSREFLNDFEINVMGAFNVIQKYLSNLKSSSNASIVFISSVAANTGMPYHSSIASAKAAIEGLSLSLSAELAPAIRVNTIAPSLVITALSQRFINTPEKLDSANKRHPLKSIGNANDIASVIEFLLSENSRWITGQVIKVDGGIGALRIG